MVGGIFTRPFRGWRDFVYGVRIADDRGVRVPLVKRRAIGEGLSDFQRRELRSRIPFDRMRVVVIAFATIAGVTTAMVAWRAINGKPVYVGAWWSPFGREFMVLVWCGWLFANFVRMNEGVDFGKKVVEPCLKWGVCASCGYTLRDASVQEDGRVVCSECGAAWKRERVG
jgi:hypothetical protein